MSLRKIGFYILSFLLVFASCKKDDDGGDDTIIIELRDRAEQQVIDNDSIIDYLETHYYNKSAFEGNLSPKISDLIISEVTEDMSITGDADSLLINAVETKEVFFADTDYEYYILRLNQGGGSESPNFSDTVRVVYQGFTLDGNIFDSNLNPVNIDLTQTLSGVYGWVKVFPQFNTNESFIENGDGTVDYFNHGSGVMFLPSGIAYFNQSLIGISSYSPLVFKFDLLQTGENDHDEDGVPSYLEDLNSDDNFNVNFEDLTDETDDDTDGDGNPNYFDPDDDGDGVLTINEDLEDTDLDVDSDGDGDPTNDKNGDGDPTNDDTDGDGIPNYLDSDDAESKL